MPQSVNEKRNGSSAAEELKVGHPEALRSAPTIPQFMLDTRSALPTAGHPFWGKAVTQLGEPISRTEII
ncbi:hypothetical protein PN498_21040 [Oscillatoria sp. CS-180]|uniref:hypothetical protein n=1 Tax=Oscillatoria sp. CS-180 TaxID=3021720 RepID=UPI00232FAFAA|nr:hypothetical protein [Oscillatoria sp. CS-180]MDB9528491.1 hypothetical protein [Oscillatoria sp. CS-180]